MPEPVTTESVRRYFDGPYFALNFGIFSRARPLLRSLFRRDEDGITDHCCRLLEDVAPRSVLDLGCGSGRLLAELHRRAPAVRLSGVELSERTLAVARRRLQSVPEVTLEHAPIESCRALNQDYDAVTCIGIHDYLPFTDEAFRRMLNAARNIVVVTVPRHHRTVRRTVRRAWLAAHGLALHAVTEREVEAICERAADGSWHIETRLPAGLEDNYWIVARRR